jgi:hypothetical protein
MPFARRAGQLAGQCANHSYPDDPGDLAVAMATDR